MNVPRIAALFFTVTAFAITPASAQSAPSRGFVRALGGVTFVTEVGTMAGGGAGVHLTSHLVLIGEAGRFTNVLPKSLQADLDDVAPILGAQFGSSLEIDGRARATYGMVGLRLVGRRSAPVAPFVEAMAGRARGTSVIRASAAGADATAAVERALGMPRSETHAMFAAGGGVSIAASKRVVVELGYRYVRIQLGSDDPKINTSALHSALRLGF